MTNDEMDKVEFMREEDFERGEFLILNYAREWVFTRGKPEGGIIERYRDVFSGRERSFHLKLIRGMDFLNRLRITFGGSPYRNSCSLDRSTE